MYKVCKITLNFLNFQFWQLSSIIGLEQVDVARGGRAISHLPGRLADYIVRRGGPGLCVLGQSRRNSAVQQSSALSFVPCWAGAGLHAFASWSLSSHL